MVKSSFILNPLTKLLSHSLQVATTFSQRLDFEIVTFCHCVIVNIPVTECHAKQHSVKRVHFAAEKIVKCDCKFSLSIGSFIPGGLYLLSTCTFGNFGGSTNVKMSWPLSRNSRALVKILPECKLRSSSHATILRLSRDQPQTKRQRMHKKYNSDKDI